MIGTEWICHDKEEIMMKTNKLGKLMLTTGVLAGVMFGTVTSVSASFQAQDTGLSQVSYQKAKKKWKSSKVYKLAFFENESSNNDDRQYWTLGYYKGSKLKQQTLDSDGDSWQEIVDPNLKTAYVVITGTDFVIHRPPYNMYNQPAVSGTVTAKEGE